MPGSSHPSLQDLIVVGRRIPVPGQAPAPAHSHCFPRMRIRLASRRINGHFGAIEAEYGRLMAMKSGHGIPERRILGAGRGCGGSRHCAQPCSWHTTTMTMGRFPRSFFIRDRSNRVTPYPSGAANVPKIFPKSASSDRSCGIARYPCFGRLWSVGAGRVET